MFRIIATALRFNTIWTEEGNQTTDMMLTKYPNSKKTNRYRLEPPVLRGENF